VYQVKHLPRHWQILYTTRFHPDKLDNLATEYKIEGHQSLPRCWESKTLKILKIKTNQHFTDLTWRKNFSKFSKFFQKTEFSLPLLNDLRLPIYFQISKQIFFFASYLLTNQLYPVTCLQLQFITRLTIIFTNNFILIYKIILANHFQHHPTNQNSSKCQPIQSISTQPIKTQTLLIQTVFTSLYY